MSLIKCVNLSLSYENNTVIKDLSFSVNMGDHICIVGENGSGKSTLIKALLGLKAPSSGKILFGEGLHSTDIGYLPQQTGAQKDFPASVYEVVLSGCLNSKGMRPFFSKEDKNRAEEAMKRLNISELKKRSYRELSGGQQQRVLLARALCATQKLLLLDEPVTGLDPHAAHELYEIIKELNESGVTIIMVSHDICGGMKYASHILHLCHGEEFFGTVEEYKNSNMDNNFLHSGKECSCI
ncbi:MAG: ABC transporter ATP-binding protein [Ruminococcaceae bacterium]|nr:ABC transporter ATP-binding protein [Oscillospiraceae bacterium]